jgi:hypothetical protein
MSALTISQLLLTALIEGGLGLTAWIGFCKIYPYIRRKATVDFIFDRTFTTISNPLIWIVQPWRYSRIAGIQKTVQNTKPMYWKYWILDLFISKGFILALAELIPTYYLLTSVGWKLPFLSHLNYNMIYATTNGAPNGAHITSYLSVMVIMLFVSWKTKDTILGVLSGCLLVGVHEGFWMLFYYSAYGQYVNASMITNLLKDFPIFTSMIVFFVYAFTKYPFNYWKIKEFKIPILIYLAYLILWFFVPHMINSYYGFLPIRTANLPNSVITTTQWNETKYFWNPYVNTIEVISWLMLCAGLMVVFARKKIERRIIS